VFAGRRFLELLALGSPTLRRAAPFAPTGALAGGLLLLTYGGTEWRPSPIDETNWMQREVYFRAGVCALPPGDKIVFVNPRPEASPHHILVDNNPRWRTSDTWVVRSWTTDRNRALLDAAPERAAYQYEEKAGWLIRMNRDGTPSRQGVVNVLEVDPGTGRGYQCR
jgi:hypothetical protein